MATYFPHRLTDTDPFLAVFRPLTALSLSVVNLFQPSRPPVEIMSFDHNVLSMLNAANNITSLSLGQNDLAGVTSPFRFEDFRFSALTSLTLRTVVFAGLPDDHRLSSAEEGPSLFDEDEGQPLTVEMFILNHRATLQRLALDDCVVALPDGRWHRVFRRFRAQLSKLVEFVWTTRACSPEVEQLDAPFFFLHGHAIGTLLVYKVDDTISFTPQPDNLAALEDLQSAVAHRKKWAES
jgi:hypothetical protein